MRSLVRHREAFLGLECRACGAGVESPRIEPTCPACGSPLLARYDLARVAATTHRDDLAGTDLWRWGAFLPFAAADAVRLGEGGTPLIPLPKLAEQAGLGAAWIKDESANPTQSFKARGLALAVSAARLMGVRAIALPSAGNAGSAAAAYAAAAGIACRITVPDDTPEAFLLEQRALGAEVRLVPGTIADAGRALADWAPAPEWWNVATFKEPFRLEGKKTLGLEIAEQTGWDPPDVVLYPTGGGTGLVGMRLAFQALRELGWIPREPRLVAVQVQGCAPVVRAFAGGAERIAPWVDARTVALGLRVPAPFADRLILEAIRGTGGTAIAVEEAAMLAGMSALARDHGVFACPEGGATLAALEGLLHSGGVRRGERVLLFNTGSGLKYLEAWRAAPVNPPAG